MNSQDFRNLQEAYLNVYDEGKVPWDDSDRPLQSGHTPAEKNRAKRARTGVEDPNKSQMDISDRSMSRYGGMKTADDTETSKAPKQKKTLFGKPKPLEHETPPHEFKKDRKLDPKQTGNEYSMNQQSFGKGNATRGQARRAVGAEFAGSRDGDSSIFPTPIQQGDPRRRTSKKWGGPNPKTKNENVDLYNIILSHLLDEGYAETPEAAEAIMVNMSEDWKQDIMEKEDSEYEKASDAALDKRYGYGRASGDKRSFGRAANRSSAAAALRAIRRGERSGSGTSREAGSDAVHQGWAKTAKTSTDQTPEKKEKRKKLADTSYSNLPDDEKEKDRVSFDAVRAIYNKNKK